MMKNKIIKVCLLLSIAVMATACGKKEEHEEVQYDAQTGEYTEWRDDSVTEVIMAEEEVVDTASDPVEIDERESVELFLHCMWDDKREVQDQVEAFMEVHREEARFAIGVTGEDEGTFLHMLENGTSPYATDILIVSGDELKDLIGAGELLELVQPDEILTVWKDAGEEILQRGMQGETWYAYPMKTENGNIRYIGIYKGCTHADWAQKLVSYLSGGNI